MCKINNKLLDAFRIVHVIAPYIIKAHSKLTVVFRILFHYFL